jgi:hypothetical protein
LLLTVTVNHVDDSGRSAPTIAIDPDIAGHSVANDRFGALDDPGCAAGAGR